MNKDHYPSLELCKKLKEIGFPSPEREFEVCPGGIINQLCYSSNAVIFDSICEYIPAYSVMEMLDVIPKTIGEEYLYINTDSQIEQTYEIGYADNDFNCSMKGFVKNTISNALASMIIWLEENKHISFK